MNRELKEIQVGKVMLTPKGEYDASKNYVRLDVVTHKGSSYVCLADTTSEPPNDSWQLLAEKGTDGEIGKTGSPGRDGKDGQPGRDGTDGKNAYQIWLDNGHSGTETDFLNSLKGAPGKDGKDAPLPDMSQYALVSSLDKLKATLNSNIDASKVAYEQIYPTLINGTTGSVNAFLITLSEKVKMLAFWANVTLPTIQSWSQVDIMSFPQMHEQNHITLNQSVIPDNYHSLWADYSSTNFSLRNQTGTTVSNYSFNFFGSGIFLY